MTVPRPRGSRSISFLFGSALCISPLAVPHTLLADKNGFLEKLASVDTDEDHDTIPLDHWGLRIGSFFSIVL